MRITQLSGIFLATVMLCGSIPLGFSEPLRVQLEQGMEINEIQCDGTNHVLVYRTNGKLACVSERTADRLGWEIISDSIQKIIYDYPLSSKDNQSENNDDVSSVGYIWPSDVEITISNLPKIGETAEVTVTYTNLDNTETFDFMKKTLTTYKNLEIVSINGQTDNLPVSIDEPLVLAMNQTETIYLVVEAVEEGKSKITARFDEDSAKASISMFIGEKQTLLLEDYERLHPSQASPPLGLGPDEIWDPDMETIESSVDDFGDTPDPFEGMTESEIRAELVEMGYEGTELEEFVREILAELYPNLNSQSFLDSIIPKAYASSHTTFSLRGNIFNSVSDYDTTGKTTVYGVRVCAVDKNLSTGSFAFLKNTSNRIACTNTTEQGTYALRSIVNNDPNDNTNVDLYLYFSTNGNYVNVKKETERLYAASHEIQDNFSGTGTTIEDVNLSGTNTFKRAAWILDTLHDAREFFDDENMRIKSVDVIWEYNKELEDVRGHPSTCNDNACYVPSTSTIWLGGTDPNESSSFGDERKIWTQLHEYGHHVMRDEYGLSGWGGCDGTSHSLRYTNSETCAWSEGWADFVPHLVTNDSKIQRSTSSWIDLEKDGISRSASTTDNPYRPFPTEIGRPAYDVGHLSEGQVASMLWDIKDNVQDSIHDKRYGSPKDNINVSRNANDDNILSAFGGVKDIVNDFYLQWNTENPSKPLNSIADLHHIVVNELPTANAQTVDVSSTDITTITLTGSDPENEKLRFFKVTNPSKGTLSPNDAVLPRGGAYVTSTEVTYTPNSGATGTDSFTFRVKDSSYFSSIVTVTINIQAIAQTAPVIENVSNVRVAEGSSTTINVRATDTNNDSITLSLQDNPSWATIQDNGDGTGIITVNVPDEVSQTRYSMKAVATDNDGTDSDTFRVYIAEVNQDPSLASIGSQTVREKSNLSFTVSASDADIPAQTLRYSITNTPPQQPDDIPDNINFNTSTGAFSWTPNNSQKGFHSYVFTVTDSSGATDSETVSIIVTAIPNSSPRKTVTPTSGSVTSTSATISWSAPSAGSGPITGYDIFREASPKILIATVPATQLSYVDSTVLPSTTYQYTVSAKNQFGSGEESDPITITTLSDVTPPVIVINPPNLITLTQGDIYSELGASCTDNIDGNISNVAIVSNVDTTLPGTYQVTYDCQDIAGNDAVQVIRTVNVVIPQVPPVLSSISDVTINEGDTKSFAASATDDNNDTITYSLSNSPAWVTISGVTITISAPSELSDTSYSGTVVATDNDGTDTDTFTINITEVNQIPSLGLIDDINSEANQLISFTTDEIALYRDGMYTGDYTTPDDSGNWSFDVMLNEGENTLGVVAYNYNNIMFSPDDVIVTLVLAQ